MPYLHTLPNGSLLLILHVQPRSSRNELAGLHGNTLKLRLTAPPVEGKANKAVIAFLAKQLHLPKSSITIKSGLQGREKHVVISGCREESVRQILTGGNSQPKTVNDKRA